VPKIPAVLGHQWVPNSTDFYFAHLGDISTLGLHKSIRVIDFRLERH